MEPVTFCLKNNITIQLSFTVQLLNKLKRDPILSQLNTINKTFCAGIPAVAAGKEDGKLGEFRNKLLSFLDISTSYEPARLISDFPFDGKFTQ